MKTAELTGALLDYWVARAEGLNAKIVGERGNAQDEFCMIGRGVVGRPFQPSTDWADGGPLIEEEIDTLYDNGGRWAAKTHRRAIGAVGDTPLQAVCRAVVRAAFGDEVEDVPL